MAERRPPPPGTQDEIARLTEQAAQVEPLTDYAKKAADGYTQATRQVQEAARQVQEAERLHKVRLSLLVDMWAASLIGAQQSGEPAPQAASRDQFDQAVRGSVEQYSKLSDGVSDLSLRDSR